MVVEVGEGEESIRLISQPTFFQNSGYIPISFEISRPSDPNHIFQVKI